MENDQVPEVKRNKGRQAVQAYHEDVVREVSLRICSTLDIKESLHSAFEYLKEQVPLDLLSLIFVDDRLGALRLIGEAFEINPVPGDDIMPLSEWMLQQLEARSLVDAFIINPKDKLFRELAPTAEFERHSDLLVPLRLGGRLLGGILLRACGEQRYNEYHCTLAATLAQPFAVALVNALAHEEVLRYQAILLDDKRFLNRELYGDQSDQIIGGTSGLRNVMEMVGQVAPLSNTLLLLGETGTGKEVIANAIHFSSPRKNGPFIKVNCGALPENLIDSELFGHEKGAFTGAIAESRGRFERATGGTIFLDEIGELPLTAQVRLLRVLQTHEVERVGGKKTIPVDIRVIAATHRNLQAMVAEGRFREDLWYRLSSFPILVPPLRQRKEDVPALTRHFVEVKSRELGILVPPTIAPGGLLRLSQYNWPGNVRELENLVERELILNQRGPLTFEQVLPQQESKVPPAVPGTGSLYPFNLDEAMAVHIVEVLKVTGGKIHGSGGAAELMGINANTLRTRMEKLGIPFPRQASRR